MWWATPSPRAASTTPCTPVTQPARGSEMEIPFLSGTELCDAYASAELSPVEVVESVLERIERLNPELCAYLTVTRAVALDAGHRAEAAYRAGDHQGLPLLGVPF